MPLLPKPYQDEVIGSVIARACCQYGLPMRTLLNGIYGAKRSPPPLLMTGDPHRLGELAGVSGEELVIKHTLFPYVVSFMHPQEQQALLAKILRGQQINGALASLSQRVTLSVPFRRVCVDCIKAEMRMYGQTYWHRAHHLPGVYYCLEHGTRLRNTDIGVHRNSSSTLIALPHQVQTSGTFIRLAPAKLQEIATISAAALNGELPTIDNWCPIHREAIRKLGYEMTTRELATRHLAADVRLFYGAAFLNVIGCRIYPEKNSAWPSLAVRTHRSVTLPSVKHILMIAFSRLASKHEGDFSYKNAGMRCIDRDEQDKRVAKQIRRTIRGGIKSGVRLTVKELFAEPVDWSAFRHSRERFPRTNKLIRKFRFSELSNRKVGGRGRK